MENTSVFAKLGGSSVPRLGQSLVVVVTTACVGAGLELAIIAYRRFVEHRWIRVPAASIWLVPVIHVVVAAVAAAVALAAIRLARGAVSWRALWTTSVTLFMCQGLFGWYPRLHYLAILVLAVAVGWRAGFLGATRPRTMLRVAGGGAALVLIVALIGAIRLHALPRWHDLAGLRSAADASSSRPNVLVLILDTVRRDHLSLYGYRRATTPTIDSLARNGIVFEQAISVAPWTLPAHASIFTGRWPHELTADWLHPLDRRQATLAELFDAAHYRTGAFIANAEYAGWETGLDRGFATFEDYGNRPGQLLSITGLQQFLLDTPGAFRALGRPEIRTSADRVRAAFARWVETPEWQGRRFFAVLNFFDAHHPYRPAPAELGLFGGPHAADDRTRPLRVGLGEIERDSSAREAAISLYDEAIRTIDRAIGDIVALLRERQLLDKTVIVVTADHGELFGEHGLTEHGNALYAPLLAVPLVVVYPGVRGPLRVPGVVSVRDLGATIWDLAGAAPAVSFPGTSLRWSWTVGEQTKRAGSPAVSEVSGWPKRIKAERVRLGDMASIFSDSTHGIRNGDGSEEYFGWKYDPASETLLPGGIPADLKRVLDSVAPRAWTAYGIRMARVQRAGATAPDRSP